MSEPKIRLAQVNNLENSLDSIYTQANSARSQANTARDQANTARDQANNAYAQANLAFTSSNNANLLLGGVITGTLNVTQDIIIGGNVYLEGNTTFINVATYSVEDSLIYLASNNQLTDSVDIGIMGGKNTSGTYSHTGLARDATDGKWKLFDGLPEEGHIGNVINFNNAYLATLVANVEANTLSVVNGVSGNVNFDSGTLFVDSVANEIGIGTTNPSANLHINGNAVIGVNTNTGFDLAPLKISGTAIDVGIQFSQAMENAGAPRLMFSKTRGTLTSPTTVQTNDQTGSLRFNGYVGSTGGFVENTGIYSEVDGTVSNTLTGLGGRLTLFTRAPGGNLTERLRVDANGNVSIGTTNPSTRLTISKPIDSAAYGSGTKAIDFKVYFPGYDLDTIKASIYAGVSSQGVLQTTKGYLAFLTSSTGGVENLTEKLRIEADGNVGIGTTNPGSTLSVRGSTNLGDSHDSSTSSLHSTRISGYALRYDVSTRYGAYGKLLLHANDAWTSGARRWLITNGFNATKFAIIRSVDASTDPDIASDAGGISSGNADLVIDNAGNVGINNGSPAVKLHVSGAVRISGNTWIDTENSVNLIRETRFGYSSSYRAVQVGVTESTRAISLGYDVSTNLSGGFTGHEIIIPNNKAIIAATSDNSGFVGVLRIDSANNLCLGGGNYQTLGHVYINNTSGNVGIGTSNPATILNVVGAATTGSIETASVLRIGRPLTNAVSFDQYADFKIGRYAVPGGSYESYTRLDIDLRDNTSSSTGQVKVMTLTNAGNVGIATTNPTVKLHVVGDVRVGAASTGGSAAGNLYIAGNRLWRWIAGYSPDYGVGNGFGLFDDTAGAYRIAVDSSGNIGIGTNTPAARLHVYNTTPNSGRPAIYADLNYGNAGDTSAGLRLNLNSGIGGGYIAGYSGEFVLAHNVEFISGSGYTARDTTATIILSSAGQIDFRTNTGLTAGSVYTPTTRLSLTSSGTLRTNTSGVQGIQLNQDTATAAVSSRLFFTTSSGTTCLVGSVASLLFQTGATVGSTSGTPSLVMNQYGLGVGAATPSSGAGIAFPATQSASSDANTLDDYEEGTWTPELRAAGTLLTQAYSYRSGIYHKIGRMVHIHFGFLLSSLSGTNTDVLRVYGLPFASATTGGYQEPMGYAIFGNQPTAADSNRIYFYVGTGSAYLEARQLTGGDTPWASNNIDGDTFCKFSMIYWV